MQIAEQLPQPCFNIRPSGIELSIAGSTYAESILDVSLSYAELEPYVDKEGLLGVFYE